MNKIDNYSIYQNNYYENTVKKNEKNDKTQKTKTDETKKKKQVELSDKAKALLQELQKKYGNMDFIIANYETEEEAASYLSRGTKEFTVLIEPELLEEMAADDSVKEKYLGIIDGATQNLQDMKQKLGEEGKDITRLGITIDKDGTVSYFAELEQLSEKRQEHLEKTKENKKAEKAEQERTKRAQVRADSIEELLEKIKNLDWDKIREEEKATSGDKFDLSI
ncbi:MAG: hypothetical protein J1F22_01390 [Lachnospiraceae bacterium]|nr:hypothetical protein [Lachnospiraceae bacterium]